MDAMTQAWTIYVRGRAIGAEFGTSARDAIQRYAEGSTYPEEEMSARPGIRPGEHPKPKPPTIWEALAARLGREPTHAEACAEVRRILRDEPIPAEAKGA